MKKQIERLAKALAEKRSDISDILNKIAQGDKWSVRDIEHRFIRARLPDGREVEYDTLTTEMRYFNATAGVWVIALDHEYLD